MLRAVLMDFEELFPISEIRTGQSSFSWNDTTIQQLTRWYQE